MFIQQQQYDPVYAKQMFDSPLTSKNDEFINMNHMLDQNGKPLNQYQIIMHVNNKMTIQQLISAYLDANHSIDKQEFMNKKPVLVYDQELALDESWTIEQMKLKVDLDRLAGQQFRLYEQNDIYFIKLQGHVNYNQFEKKYKGQKSEFTIKFQSLERYLYITSPRGTLISELQTKITQLSIQEGIIIKKNAGFILKYDLNETKNEQLKNKKYKVYQKDKKNFIHLSQYKYQPIRDFVGYGETIILQSFKPDSITLQDPNIKNDFNIEIQVYVGNANPQQLQKSKKTIAYKTEDIVDIYIPYSKARTMKVKTLLCQHNVPNYQQISLICQNLYLKPIDKFTKIEQSKAKIGNKIKFIGITQNFLFYKQIRQFCKNQNTKTMEQIYQQLIFKKIFDIHNIQQCKKKVKERVNELDQESYKIDDFLNPIVLYTSPLIHNELNLFARQTSAAQFDIHTMLAQYWQFPFSQKLVKSLQVIPNFKGQVYRGVKNIAFNYNKNDIIQFNSFTSTSKNKKIALGFLAGGHIMTLIKIQTFSGKEISRFSFFKHENQVLLFPYTKFKVLRTQYNETQKIHQIDLLQIPVPKKIPGDIVVWVDANIKQNSQTFNKIVQANKIKNLQIIQLKSNQHLEDWIRQFKPILSLHDVNIHFITNLNRPPVYEAEGVQTLRIIRRLRPQANVVFYIGSIQKTLKALISLGFAQEANLNVINHPKDLKQIICSWKREID